MRGDSSFSLLTVFVGLTRFLPGGLHGSGYRGGGAGVGEGGVFDGGGVRGRVSSNWTGRWSLVGCVAVSAPIGISVAFSRWNLLL